MSNNNIKVILGEICDVRDGTHDSPDYVETGFPLITSKNLSTGTISLEKTNYISEADYNKINERSFVDDGDILMPMIGTIGNPVLVNKQFNFAIKNVALIKFNNPKTIFNKFIFYILSSNQFKRYAEQENRGGTQKFISLNNIRKFQFILPPFEEQIKTSKILDNVNNLIEIRKKQIIKLDKLIKSQFVKMFGDTITNNKKWTIKQLDELGIWQSGGTPSRNNIQYFSGDINWYSAGELNNLYLYSSIEKITKKAINESSAKMFKKGSMLVGMYDTAAFKMGILLEDSSSNQACANILPNKLVNIVWLYYNLMYMKNYFLLNRRGIRQKNLNLGMIKKFKVPIPPIELQNQFALYFHQIDKQKIALQNNLNELNTFYSALMQNYFG